MAKWINRVLAVLVMAGIGLDGYSLATPNKVVTSDLSLSTNQLKVVGSTSCSLSTNMLTADTPPTGTSPCPQAGPSSLDQASNQPLQSNANINDPSLASNPLVQSVLNPNQ